MKVTTFQARDMREALKEVKAKLGADAVILSTRSIREPGGGLTLGRTLIEVTACPSPNAKEAPAQPAAQAPTASSASASPFLAQAAGVAAPGVKAQNPSVPSGHFSRVVDDPIAYPDPTAGPPTSQRTEGLRYGRAALPSTPRGEAPYSPSVRAQPLEEPRYLHEPPTSPPMEQSTHGRLHGHATEAVVAGLRAATEEPHMNPAYEGSADAMGAMGLDAEGRRQYNWLLMHGVEEPVARNILLMDRAGGERGLAAAFQRALKFRDPLNDSTRIIALVGPTGVGKTTTLAKIAADLILNRQRSVGMITLDTFRVGAVAQLETYAKLLQVRLVVARSLSEVKAGLHALNRCDYVLLDTVGSSPYNRRQVNSTAGLLPVIGEGREVILCMAANVREAEQQAIYRRFSILEPTGLIFTKLDETVTYGGILNVSIKAGLPLTLYTDGQRVPENLGWMSPKTLAQWFERESHMEN